MTIRFLLVLWAWTMGFLTGWITYAIYRHHKEANE